uniref:Proteasome assembly chaperone 4 n=1 Tax=Zea mays TaxID=4577 RepID=C0HE48_MAIZE|nr:unknown [Zea mays]
MSSEELRASFSDLAVGSPTQTEGKTYPSGDLSSEEVMQVTCFTEDLHDVVLHFQIVRFSKQIYVWVGCNTAKFGHLYAAATTRPDNRVSVTSVLGGTSDNTGSSMARRLGSCGEEAGGEAERFGLH